tara:strand:+ start:268 stop:402 length:135 start_codon:yes stop_codon:yes gene_type:complete
MMAPKHIIVMGGCGKSPLAAGSPAGLVFLLLRGTICIPLQTSPA